MHKRLAVFSAFIHNRKKSAMQLQMYTDILLIEYWYTLIFYWKKEGLFSDLEWSQTTQLFLNWWCDSQKIRTVRFLFIISTLLFH